ncbi:hypoxanthine/guanine phosphoribosyltransferase [Methanolapillus millepedarum]|uniref:Adenine phosphoribosyltransferase n=1 Tax=Methanolapillus millepedarum TaxID=3028296 RepID=A0AA96ZU64_9EURY|nr:Adenine phosphoribosyltransferase [Methanosarcinaceae archaeon Ac7]
MLEKLKKSLIEAPVIQKESDGNIYNYFVHPISDGIPAIGTDILDEISDFIIQSCGGCSDIDAVLTVESMGIPIAIPISMKTGVPTSIVRKRQYGLPGEVELSQSTGYSKGKLYLNGLKKGDRVLVVDDVISTGGTLLALLKCLDRMGVAVAGIFCVIGRGCGPEIIERETGHKVTVLVDIDVTRTGVTISGGNG